MAMKLAGYRLKTTEGCRLKPAPKTVAEHYRTPEHQAWRNEVLLRAMFRCQHPGCTATIYNARLFADHIVELKDGGAALDPENGQALCGKHHTKKTMRERAKRAKA